MNLLKTVSVLVSLGARYTFLFPLAQTGTKCHFPLRKITKRLLYYIGIGKYLILIAQLGQKNLD